MQLDKLLGPSLLLTAVPFVGIVWQYGLEELSILPPPWESVRAFSAQGDLAVTGRSMFVGLSVYVEPDADSQIPADALLEGLVALDLQSPRSRGPLHLPDSILIYEPGPPTKRSSSPSSVWFLERLPSGWLVLRISDPFDEPLGELLGSIRFVG